MNDFVTIRCCLRHSATLVRVLSVVTLVFAGAVNAAAVDPRASAATVESRAGTVGDRSQAKGVAIKEPAKEVGPRWVGADGCVGDPKFLEKVGLSKRALVDTISSEFPGLSILEVDANGKPVKRVQHPSWRQAGYLGKVQRDRDGNVFVYPAPSVNMSLNPVEKANIVYRVDSTTGLMAAFAEVPGPEGEPLSVASSNPFGVLALAYDCDQDALYVASVRGSSAATERGVLARIDLKSATVRVLRRNIDALSLTVARAAGPVVADAPPKRLFVGLARDNVIVSYGITSDGDLVEDERTELSLTAAAAQSDIRPRQIRLDARGVMTVRFIPFEYTLVPRAQTKPTEQQFVKSGTTNGFVPMPAVRGAESRGR